jgi:DNA-binding response OmpR family regulator
MIQAVVVTRDKELLETVKEAAAGLPMKLAESRSLKAAIELFRTEPSRLVILDLFLGETGNGLDAIKTLKKMDDSLAIILLSRMSTRGVLERAFRSGAGDVVVYPFKPETLRATLMHRLDGIGEQMIVFHQE